ncbi:LuxR C-terminal-related transcriptional regulator [Arthrobacter sp. GMC3]|uniref:LuxR C-terminal-related transcriptional regulator n=1 Tax=Arthrobacter sp. GMC3 TaxID=2058894 RepID=UPI000CE5191C|nr:LuxR C-terminal-related transcriptional regulator [Arthrobacter sp. GMC3]
MARGASIGKIVAQLADTSSRGVLVVGLPGTGKTWMLGQVLTALGEEAVAIRLSPSKVLSAVPFGAVNARVGPTLIRSSDYYEVLNGLLEEIRGGFERAGHVVLMVDNGEFLDESSAAVIMQAIMSTHAKLLLVDRPGHHHTHLRELWRDGHLSRFEMEALKPADVRSFLEDVLGGTVSSAAADYLWSRSAGNPLALKGLVSGAMEERSLHQIDGVWMLEHPGDKLGSEARELLQMEIDRLNPPARRVLEILALAGPLPLDVVLDLADPEAVDEITQRDMVSRVPGERVTLWLSRPVTAASIRRMVPFGRRRRLLEEVTAIFAVNDDSTPEMLINFTRWAVDCGVPVPDAQVLAAATWANQLFRANDALYLCSLPVADHCLAALRAQRSIAQLNQNHVEHAQSLAVKSLAEAVTPDVGASAIQALHLAFASDPSHSSHVSEGLRRYEEKFGAVRLTVDSTHADVEVLTVQAMSELASGDSTSALELVLALLEHPLTANRIDKTLLKSLLCEIHTAMGRLGSAAALADDIMAELDGPQPFPRLDIALLAHARAALAYIGAGNWAAAGRVLQPQVFPHPELSLIGGGLRELAAATMHIRRGHIDEALAVIVPAVGLLAVHDPWLMLPSAWGAMAYCLAVRGDSAGAQKPLDQLSAAAFRGTSSHQVGGAAYAAAARILTGHGDGGFMELEGLLHTCQERGHAGTELTVLTLLIQAGAHTHVPRLAEVAELLDAEDKIVFQDWAAALASQDPATMAQAGHVAKEFGFDRISRELAVAARGGSQDEIINPWSLDAAHFPGDKPAHSPVPPLPSASANGKPKMTRREYEIAALVSQGKSNSAVAEHLNVSLRTVEGHLYRTFIKMGLQSREQLAALLVTELAS